MTINREVFATDPDSLELLNHGVAEVKGGRTEAELRTLRYELSTFVCQGQYESGLRKVLDTYLANLGKTEQPGIWVSGFFGSGKSHLVKVLRALWTDEPFADGTQPRGLAHLITEINDALRADAETLADLLVQNLEHGGAEVRKAVPAALQALVDAGQLMQVETEYRVQTRESAAWEADFQKHRKALSDDDTKVGTLRGEALADAAKKRLGTVSVPHGASKVPRKVVMHFGPVAPTVEAGAVPVWVRDAWAESESTIQTDAMKAGNESPLVFVLLPNRNADEIKKALVTLKAAETTLQTRGVPSNDEGNLARAAVQTRRDRARDRLAALLDEVLDNAQVIQAGGNEVTAGTVAGLDRAKIGLSKFTAETVPLTPLERIGVRQLMQKAGVPCKSNEEPQQAPPLVAELKRRAAAAGGEPPAPAAPSTAHLLALDGLAGNALVKKLYEAKDELSANVDAWDKLAKAIESRLPRYRTLQFLLTAAATLHVAALVAAQRDALRDGRGLLTEPDPLPHLCEQVTTALREALVGARDAWRAVYDAELAGLIAAEAWARLPEEHRQGLLVKHGIATVPSLTVGTMDEVLRAAQARSPSQWALDQAGLPGRFAAARLEAIQLVAPKAQSVSLPKATLHTAEEVETWIGEARAAILAKLGDGPVVV